MVDWYAYRVIKGTKNGLTSLKNGRKRSKRNLSKMAIFSMKMEQLRKPKRFKNVE